MIIKYFTFSLSITTISWIVGMLFNVLLQNSTFYKKQLSDLNFIKSDRLNQLIGLGFFKWMVKNTFFKFFNPKLHLKTRIDQTDLDTLRREMTTAEISHLIAFMFVCFFALDKFLRSDFLFGCTMMIVNIGMNLYPSLLQQVNKRRIDKLAKKLQRTAMRQSNSLNLI
ncbi:hypothetical protein [Olivibacter sp. XZL3]|uniref:glycosyl-4,4'-diaponeurosporenoate acyltransferase CrtO family protein n=1 Tax=Olivibacter sp. XZL3 TaxID=1735116 RepID=UPI0010662B98|nr:hypothetical protein [Olivibacter sp. XZL3]